MVSDESRPLDNFDLAVSVGAVATDTLNRMCSQKVSLIHRVMNECKSSGALGCCGLDIFSVGWRRIFAGQGIF